MKLRRRRPSRLLAQLRAPARARPDYSGGNAVSLLKGGDQLFPAMTAAMRAARNEIWLGTYILYHDMSGNSLVDELLAASRRGVRVHVVVDGYGSMASLDWLRQRLGGSAVALEVFRPIDRWWRWLQPGQLRRLHQKICVVDSTQAFVGGINIIDDRRDLHHGLTDTPRLDFAISATGPLVKPIEQAVRAVWTRAHLGSDLREELSTLAHSPSPLSRLRLLARSLNLVRRTDYGDSVAHLPPMRAAFVLRDNLRRRRTIERAYVEAIQRARERVDLITPYFYPGTRFRKALCQAARRGVRVRLLLQGKVDYRIAGMAAHALYAELLGRGVQVFEYTPAYLHAKIAVVDQDWATVGSSNIDPLSLLLNLEANVIVRDPVFTAQLESEFEAAIAVSRQVQADTSSGLRAMLRRAVVAWGAYVYLRVAGATGRY
ncbi:MAG: cardiolipin synthase ClsB [Burkholderiaceae bacterium]|nr:cardiolipin synthase ClsB [Burkholderiaceae bacterium]